MFGYDEVIDGVRFAFTDRFGGVSKAPYGELNLGNAAGDQPDAVTENFRRVASVFGVPDGHLVRMNQVHGSDVFVVRTDDDLSPMRRADALVTSRDDVALCARAADCVPVLLADAANGVVGAVHSGRPGLAAGVAPAAVAVMRQEGAARITAVVGPHICGRCYEVPAGMREEVADLVPAAYAETSWGSPALDIGAGVIAQLTALGCTVIDASRCTKESEDLYSYRREGPVSGRAAGVVRLVR